ncbi:hypothetical protein [Aerococcus urinae]|uniref:Uncharacterized protein n=1 Tax=Aerococcus urinae TaxID=1376 RepID=A0A0X8FFN8_9LACT|nr:hypothetical protein [Aerococcus urinae]AMB96483.1 hypothetical protein AWM73_08185 [Aerococcus urinae]MCY3032143.1 hypothetical protein [Aerococcus urinae]MCY3037649.1 hypothetical protein [Aerococcus urinae]MCY3044189.1 hypothetical protein [Aerococcus urinae]MCY3045685.1 hypothetical protein [Aerococcus urinae]
MSENYSKKFTDIDKLNERNMRKLTDSTHIECSNKHITVEELDAKLESSYAQHLKKEGRPIDEVFEELESRLK